MILILDLDETLVHICDKGDTQGDFMYKSVGVKKRPYLDKLIEYLTNNPYYEAGVWSAGVDEYVRTVVDNIFPDPSILRFIMSRDTCNEAYKKPLSKVRSLYNETYSTDYDRGSFVIIDDRNNITDFDELNHIRVRPYRGEENDTELLDLIEFLNNNKGLSSECLVVNWQ